MADPVANLVALLRRSTIVDDEEALNTADAVLNVSKKNLDALHTRIVALIKLDRFNDALRTLNDGGSQLIERCQLEKAYTLYKIGHLAEAEALSQKIDQRGLKHVAAQAAYRAGKFTSAAILYNDLSAKKSPIEGEDIDIKVNISAIDAQLVWQQNCEGLEQTQIEQFKENLNLFEILYNSACKYIARHDFQTATVHLRRARDICEMSDEMSDEEKKSEILPIMLQQAYVLMRLGKCEEAKALHNLINLADVAEPPTRAIAQNNFLAAAKHDNPFMTQRIYDSMPDLLQTTEHFEYQRNILQRNKFIIGIEAQKYSGVAKGTAEIISKYSPTISPQINLLSVINAAAHARNQTGKIGLKAILPLLDKRPKDVGLIITVVQLYIMINNFGQAIFRLEQFLLNLEKSTVPEDHDIRFCPGLIALLITLYRFSGRKAPIKSALSKAASHWRLRNRPSIPILRAAGVSLLESTLPEDISAAAEIFRYLRTEDPEDRIAIAGYIASCPPTDTKQMSSDLDKLTPVSSLISGIDINALEKLGVPSPPISVKKSGTKRSGEQKQVAISKKRKLSQKRMPKDFDEGKKMDPERWLPARDRSTYRPKGKKGKKKMAELTQGGFVKEHDRLESAPSTVGVVKSDKTVAGKAKKKKGKK